MEQIMHGHNVNVNQGFKNNDNVIDRVKADIIADRIISKLGNENYRAFYCKIAYSLPENVIENNLEQALKGKHPAKYFSWLCSKGLR